MEETLYFAYGSNINLEQMAHRCPDAQIVGPVTLENYELRFRGSGFATVTPKNGSVVHGLLWKLTPESERALDRYEGYPRHYTKEQVSVRTADRDVIITGAELEKFFGKEATPRQMKDQIMTLLEDWKERQPPELAKPDKKMDMEK